MMMISVFDLMTLNMFKCCARLCDNFHQVWPSTTYLYLNYSVFDADTLCQAMTLTFDPLTWKVRGTASVMWSKSVQNLSKIEQTSAELLIILRIFAHVMSRRDPDLCHLDLELLQHFRCHAFKHYTKFDRNRIIHGWVIDDLARFRVQFFGVGHNGQSFLRAAWTQLYQTRQTWPGYRAIITALHFCFRIQIYCHIFKRWWLKVEWCSKRRQISHFLTPCKN